MDPDDRVRPLGGDLLDLDAALGGAHEQDPPGAPVEHGAEVELADDVGRRGHEDLADRDALDVHAEDRPGDRLRLRGVRGELHAAGLAAPADEHLGLDDDRVGAQGESPLRGRPCLGRRPGDFPGGDRQALGHEEGLGVGFLDLHEWVRLLELGGIGPGERVLNVDGSAWATERIEIRNDRCPGAGRGPRCPARMAAWPTVSPSSPGTASDQRSRRRRGWSSRRPGSPSNGTWSTPAKASSPQYGTPLPDHVLDSIRSDRVALKGPITTPVGEGFRSVNVALRQALGLYANVRPRLAR